MTPPTCRFRLLACALATVAALAWRAGAHAELAPKATILGAGVKADAPPDMKKAAAEGKSVSLGDDSGKKTTTTLVPPSHTVRRGDTLWDLCEHYFGNPWQWPRVWSYNPEILNPHWIYPGEIVRLRRDGGGAPVSEGTGATLGGGVILKPKLVPTGTVFLRNQGFVFDTKTEDTGEIAGSPEEKMLLSTFDQVYARVSKEQADKLYPGDTLTVFTNVRPIKKGGSVVGKVVQILGTIKVDTIDKKTGLVEGTIIEAIDVIERGARVAPIERKIDQVPPSTNAVDARGTIISSIYPNVLFGANQVVLVDKGEDDGLRPGNRLFVVRKGDPWRQGLSSTGGLTASRVTVDAEGSPQTTSIDTPPDAPDYPEEVVAEIRVIRARKGTSTCLVTSAQKEIEPGDVWVAKKGY